MSQPPAGSGFVGRTSRLTVRRKRQSQRRTRDIVRAGSRWHVERRHWVPDEGAHEESRTLSRGVGPSGPFPVSSWDCPLSPLPFLCQSGPLACRLASGDETINNHASFIWSVADLLRGDYRQSEYWRVILPFTALRRFDCVLAPVKEDMLALYDQVKDRLDKFGSKQRCRTFIDVHIQRRSVGDRRSCIGRRGVWRVQAQDKRLRRLARSRSLRLPMPGASSTVHSSPLVVARRCIDQTTG